MLTVKPLEFFIQWHITERCNLACKHCYQEEQNADEMPLSAIEQTAAEISDMIDEWSRSYGIAFAQSMNITGGEPFLRRELPDILRKIKNQGFAVYLLTNGTLIDEARARMLAGAGVDGVQVSIEGPEEVHDSVRGPGSFSAAAAGIRRLLACSLDVSLNVTLSTLNARYLRGVVIFASHSGVMQVGFSRLVPCGRGGDLAARMLTKEQLRELYLSLPSLQTTGVSIGTGDPIAGQMKRAAEDDAGCVAISGCAAGVSGITILPNGDVLPCRRLPLSIGNVRRDPLRELWATSPVLEAIRDRKRYQGTCGACRRWAACRGCRAIAYAWSRARGGDDFLADDPQCFLHQGRE